MALRKTNRGYVAAAFDRLGGWYLGLPGEKCSWCVTAVRIPTRDGIELHADVYEPALLAKGASPKGTLFAMTPYGRGLVFSIFMARIYATRGYKVLLVSMRGTFGSGGVFIPGQDEAHDAADTVAWMRQQPWYPGKFATIGSSFMGWAQWALLSDPPPDCIASAICVGPHEFWDWHWGTGAFRLERVTWSNLLATQEDSNWMPSWFRESFVAAAERVSMELPVQKAVEGLFSKKEALITGPITDPLPDAEYWQNKHHDIAFERVRVDMPILLTSGWFDTFTQQTLRQYQRLYERGCQVELIVGAWNHGEAGGGKTGGDIFRFIERNVGGGQPESSPDPNLPPLPRARVFVSGADEWKTMSVWPPASKPVTMYLNSDKTIISQPPSEEAESTSFTYNPADPTPAMGGPLLFPAKAGRVDDGAYAKRADVLVFTSNAIEEDQGLEILGVPIVQLTHTSNTPQADLWIRLSEVDVNGVSHNITEEFRALPPGPTSETTVQLQLRDCAHRFKKGTKIRVIIAGGSSPTYARNLGTGEDRMTSSEMRPTTQTLTHASGKSHIILPVTNRTI